MSKKVRITCMTDTLNLPCISLKLTKGQEFVLSPVQMKNPEIQQAIRYQAIKVMDMSNGPKIVKPNKSISKTKTNRKARRIRSYASITKETPQPNVPAQMPTPKAAVDDVVIDKIVNRVVQAFESTFERLRDTPTPIIREVVREAAIPAQTATQAQMYESDVPVFIPKGIVNEDIQGDVQLKTTTVEDDGLDDVAQALRKLRKK